MAATHHRIHQLRYDLVDRTKDQSLVARDLGLVVADFLGIRTDDLTEDQHNKIGCAVIDVLEKIRVLP